MSAPFTPGNLKDLIPKDGDDLCSVMEKVAAFDSAHQANVAWFINIDGTDLNNALKLAVCTNGVPTTTSTTSTSTSTSTTTTTTAP